MRRKAEIGLLWCLVWLVACVVPGISGISGFSGTARAGARTPVTPVSVDHMNGFAISGFDPVGYFTHARAVPGRPGFELRWNDAAWMFSNAGNMEAFREHPETYAPRFGGHGVVSLSRGFLADGNPEIFLFHEGDLYLFTSLEQRDAFREAPDAFVASAVENWRRINRLPEPTPTEPKAARTDENPALRLFD